MKDCGHNPEWPGASVERVMRNGKRIFTTAFKVWLVEQASKPGVSVAGLALRHGVNANQLRHWMRLGHLRSAAEVPRMLAVTIAPVPEVAQATMPIEARSSVIEIELGGAIVRVPDGVDAQHLRIVLQALRA